MKKMRLIIVGLMLSTLVGCVTVQPTPQSQTDPGTTVFEKLSLMRDQGCETVPEVERQILLLLVKSRIPEYPDKGFCNPQLINDLLLNQIDNLEESRPEQ